MTADPSDILEFWFREIPAERWFRADAAFDREVGDRFEAVWRTAREGALSGWESTQDGALALVIVLDQFPRNMFRGRAEAFATDEEARAVAKRAIALGFDRAASEIERPFFYLPLMHSEALTDQELCLRLTVERLGEAHYSYPFAIRHKDVIARFGRFPARNQALHRESRKEEKVFLQTNPLGF